MSGYQRVPTLSNYMYDIYSINVDHGWFDEPRSFNDDTNLLHEEVSEAYREYRKGRKPNEIYGQCTDCKTFFNDPAGLECAFCGGKIEPKGIPIELIDVLIRVLDSCKRAGIDPDAVLEMKMKFNEGRPYKHGGQKV